MFTARQILTELVRRPSVNPMGRTDIMPAFCFESRVSDYIEALLKAASIATIQRKEISAGRSNIVASYEPTLPVSTTILWEAHQDTVPTDGMSIDPFGAIVKDDRLNGRGACDVKAGIAVMLSAFIRLHQTRPQTSSRILLAFTIDEEHTFLGIQSLAKQIKADFAICAEPTDLNIVVAHKGVARLQIETTGKACHSSKPESGVNAIYHMAKLITALQSYAEKLPGLRKDELLGRPTMSVGRIEGGTSPNTVPDFCKIEIDRRMIPGETTDSALFELTQYLESRSEINFEYSVSPPKLDCPPLNTSNHTLISQLEASIKTVTGKVPQRNAVPYGTNASTLANAGIPAVVFGPGSIEQAHTHDEWIDLKQVDQACEILYHFAALS